MIRNTSLPQRVRAQAQLQLSQMHAYTRPTQIKNRCVASGTARAVFRDFRINRVSDCRDGVDLTMNIADQVPSSNSVCRHLLVTCQVSRKQAGKFRNVLRNNINMEVLGRLNSAVAFSSSLHLEPVYYAIPSNISFSVLKPLLYSSLDAMSTAWSLRLLPRSQAALYWSL